MIEANNELTVSVYICVGHNKVVILPATAWFDSDFLALGPSVCGSILPFEFSYAAPAIQENPSV